MHNKRLAEYVALSGFILAMGYALIAALEHASRGNNLPYL